MSLSGKNDGAWSQGRRVARFVEYGVRRVLHAPPRSRRRYGPTAETLVVSDGKARTGAVFEMAPGHVGVRPLEDGVVFQTNHFVAPETADLDADPPAEHTTLRFDRLGQLVPKAGVDSKYGSFDPSTLIALMRDRVDPYEGTESGADVFDNGKSLATDGALYEVLFDPEALRFWVAAGVIPVPAQPFTGFSLQRMVESHDLQDAPDTIP